MSIIVNLSIIFHSEIVVWYDTHNDLDVLILSYFWFKNYARNSLPRIAASRRGMEVAASISRHSHENL